MPRRSPATHEPLPVSQEYREAWQDLRADYQAGKDSRFLPRLKGVQRLGSGADYHYRNETEFLYMVERARFFDRDNMVARQGINRLVANVLQKGFSLDVDTGDEGLDAELATRFWEWADDEDAADSEGEKTFGQMAAMALRSRIVDGDCLFLLNKEGTLQSVEAHRVRTPSSTRDKRVLLGVKLDPYGKRMEYWCTKRDIDPWETLKTQEDVEKYPVRDKEGHRVVCHVYDPERFSQRRGVTAFSTLCYALGLHDDIQFATLVKQQVASCFAIIRELPEFIEGAPPAPARDGDAKAALGASRLEDLEDGTLRTMQGIGPGMDVRGRPGEKLKMESPAIPSPEFFTHASLILTFVAINLDLPLQVFLLDPTKTNFSGWRGAIDQARMRFACIQDYMTARFYRPVYRWKVRQFAATDAAIRRRLLDFKSGKTQVNVLGHVWNPPAWKYIEPLKDAQADTLEINEHLCSGRRRAARQGLDFDDEYKKAIDDEAKIILYAKKRAAEVNAAFPGDDGKVRWEQLAPARFRESKTTAAMVTAQEAPEPAESKPGDKED